MNVFRVLLLSSMLTAVSSLSAQSPAYDALIKVADSLFDKGQYRQSAETFTKAFLVPSPMTITQDRYRAVRAWGLCGAKDSALTSLKKVIKMVRYPNYDVLSVDDAFRCLSNDKEYAEILASLKKEKTEKEKNYNWALIAELDSIYYWDQHHRVKLVKLIREKAPQKQQDSLRQLVERFDSICLPKTRAILDKYGWLCKDVIGQKGGGTLFLVIQHADLSTQEKYMPMLAEAAERNCASKGDLATMQDRVALRKGLKQRFGSQVSYDEKGKRYYVAPLEDPLNVEKRRAEINTEPLWSYLKNWNMTWDAEEYIKLLPYYESIDTWKGR